MNKPRGKPFKKGQSGNPNGRPKKGHTLTDILSEIGELQDVNINGQKVSKKKALGMQLWQMAIVEKNFAAIKYIYDRIDGTPVQAIEFEGDLNTKNETTVKLDESDERVDAVIEILKTAKGLEEAAASRASKTKAK